MVVFWVRAEECISVSGWGENMSICECVRVCGSECECGYDVWCVGVDRCWLREWERVAGS